MVVPGNEAWALTIAAASLVGIYINVVPVSANQTSQPEDRRARGVALTDGRVHGSVNECSTDVGAGPRDFPLDFFFFWGRA